MDKEDSDQNISMKRNVRKILITKNVNLMDKEDSDQNISMKRNVRKILIAKNVKLMDKEDSGQNLPCPLTLHSWLSKWPESSLCINFTFLAIQNTSSDDSDQPDQNLS